MEFAREAARLGISATLTVRQLRRWEREAPPPLPHPAQQAVLEAIFGVPLAEMGFIVPTHRRCRALCVGHDEEVKRRDFVAGSGGMAVGALLTDMPVGRIGMADVRRLRAILAELYEVDHRQGGIPAQARARELRRKVSHALTAGACTGQVSHALQVMACELACHRAWFAYDGGYGRRLEQARAACAEAMTAAQLVDSPLLQVRALNSLALIAAEAGRGWEARSAVERAYSLARTAGAGATVHLVIALREANAANHVGELTTARRALSRAMAFQARMDGDRDAPRWARFAGQVEIDYATAAWHRRAGQPRRALPFLRATVDGIGGGYTRNTAWYRTRLAQTLLDAGAVEEACAEVTGVLDACGRVSSHRLRRRLHDFAGAATGTGAAVARGPVDRIRDTLRDAS
ncbi:hypothetical protein [Streptomyces mayteni]